MYPSSDTEWLGVAAGVVVTAVLIGLLFVGPWRVFAISTANTFPVTEVEGSQGSPFVAGMVGVLFVGFVTGAAHPHLVTDEGGDEDDDHDWGDLAMGIFVPPLVTVAVGFLAMLLTPAVGSLLYGAVVEAMTQVLVGVLMAAFFAGVVATVMAVYVGLPALVGAFAGVLVGRVATPG